MLPRLLFGVLAAAFVGVEPAFAAIHVPMEAFVVILGGVVAIAVVLWGIVGILHLVQRYAPSVRFQVNLGAAEMKKARYDAAIGHFDKAVALDPKSVNAVHWRAQAHQAKGDGALALADYRTALALGPEPARRVLLEHAIRALG